MRALILVAGAALAVSACSSNEAANNTMTDDANLMATDMNTTTDLNMDMNATDANMDMNAADANMTMNSMERNDMMTNAPDTNVANGM